MHDQLRLPDLQTEIHCSVQAEVMLTPSFDTQQNEEFVILNIHVPYVKISEAEFYINGQDFKFYCKPYFLRLHLPGEVVEDGREKASYDVDSGTVVVHLPKRNHGEYFENLGMLTTLLSAKQPSAELKKMGHAPLIEVMGAEVSGAEATNCAREEEEEEFDWQMEQQLPNKEEEETQLIGAPSYGFANQQKGVFSKLQEEIPSIVDCPDPDHMTPHERRVARIAHEEASFDAEYYLADLMDNDSIDDLLKFEPPWREELARWRRQKAEGSATATPSKLHLTEPSQDILPFSAGERDQLKELPKKEYLLDKACRRILYLGLVDIIFAFGYDYRVTQGERNVESAWTICKLSSTLSWLEVFKGSVHEVVYCNLRRSLCYPLYRHWQLAQAVLQDTRDLFHLASYAMSAGRRKLLQCLLSIRSTLNSSEPYYVLNNLYITDYCVWIQKTSARQIQKLAEELDEVKVEISSLGWDLTELEQAAFLVVAEERENEKKETDEPTEREVDRQSEKTSAANAIFDNHEEHHGNCTEMNSGTCNEATSEKSAETPNSESDFNKLPCQSLAHDLSHTGTAIGHSLAAGGPIQSLSAELEKLLTLDSPFRLPAPSKPLIEEVLPPLQAEQTTQEPSEVSSSGSTCSTCSPSDSESDQN